MEILKEVETKLRDGSLKTNPHECANLRARLSSEYSFYMGALEDILFKKPKEWNSLRPLYKSDTAAEKAWEGTPMGLEEVALRMRCKRVEKLMSGLSSLIKIHEADARNQF